jgi:hypothetical protein
VTNWPFGSYSLKAIQKVSDNANGWIESAPYTFTVNRVLPDPSDIEYTNNYQPTFTGTGYNHATVKIADPGGSTFPAPNALVSAGKWSSRASQEWGPTFKRDVYFRQFLDGQQSPTWVHLIVTIPPLAPVIGPVEEDGFSPKFSGTCWLNAVVKLAFSDDPNAPHSAIVTGTNWTFQRGSGFAPDVPHRQTFEGQTSEDSPSLNYNVVPAAPFIETPALDEHIGRLVVISGFGVPRDRVTVRLGDAVSKVLGRSPVAGQCGAAVARRWQLVSVQSNPDRQ